MKTSEIFGDQEEEYFADSEVVPSYKSIFPNGGNANNTKLIAELHLKLMLVPHQILLKIWLSHILIILKSMKNDKMLLFFWIPALVIMLFTFFMVYVVGYQLNDYSIVEKC